MLLKKIKLSEVEIIGWIPPKVELIHNLKEKKKKKKKKKVVCCVGLKTNLKGKMG